MRVSHVVSTKCKMMPLCVCATRAKSYLFFGISIQFAINFSFCKLNKNESSIWCWWWKNMRNKQHISRLRYWQPILQQRFPFNVDHTIKIRFEAKSVICCRKTKEIRKSRRFNEHFHKKIDWNDLLAKRRSHFQLCTIA